MSSCLFSLSTLQKQTKRITNESNVGFITDSISQTQKINLGWGRWFGWKGLVCLWAWWLEERNNSSLSFDLHLGLHMCKEILLTMLVYLIHFKNSNTFYHIVSHRTNWHHCVPTILLEPKRGAISEIKLPSTCNAYLQGTHAILATFTEVAEGSSLSPSLQAVRRLFSLVELDPSHFLYFLLAQVKLQTEAAHIWGRDPGQGFSP